MNVALTSPSRLLSLSIVEITPLTKELQKEEGVRAERNEYHGIVPKHYFHCLQTCLRQLKDAGRHADDSEKLAARDDEEETKIPREEIMLLICLQRRR